MKHLLQKELKNRTVTLSIQDLERALIVKYLLTHFKDDTKSILV